MQASKETARILLTTGAVSISLDKPFRYASGILSPIYCDNRLVISFPEERRRVVDHLVERIRTESGAAAAEVVAGTATGGIPWAAWVADRLELPMVYVRAAAKEHGRGNRVEGKLTAGQRVVVVEDLVTTGGSSLSTVDALTEAGAMVASCVVIFSYDLPAASAAFAARGVPLFALTGLPALLEEAASAGFIPEDEQTATLAAIRLALGH